MLKLDSTKIFKKKIIERRSVQLKNEFDLKRYMEALIEIISILIRKRSRNFMKVSVKKNAIHQISKCL